MSPLLVEHSSLGQLAALSLAGVSALYQTGRVRAAVRYGRTHATQHSMAATKGFLVLRVLSFLFKVLMAGVVLSVARQYFHFRSMVGQLSHGCHEALLGNLESDSVESIWGCTQVACFVFDRYFCNY